MNKKSIILFFSALVLLTLGVFYVAGDLSMLLIGNSTAKFGDGHEVENWITNDMYPLYFSRKVVELNQKDVMYLRP